MAADWSMISLGWGANATYLAKFVEKPSKFFLKKTTKISQFRPIILDSEIYLTLWATVMLQNITRWLTSR